MLSTIARKTSQCFVQNDLTQQYTDVHSPPSSLLLIPSSTSSVASVQIRGKNQHLLQPNRQDFLSATTKANCADKTSLVPALLFNDSNEVSAISNLVITDKTNDKDTLKLLEGHSSLQIRKVNLVTPNATPLLLRDSKDDSYLAFLVLQKRRCSLRCSLCEDYPAGCNSSAIFETNLFAFLRHLRTAHYKQTGSCSIAESDGNGAGSSHHDSHKWIEKCIIAEKKQHCVSFTKHLSRDEQKKQLSCEAKAIISKNSILTSPATRTTHAESRWKLTTISGSNERDLAYKQIFMKTNSSSQILDSPLDSNIAGHRQSMAFAEIQKEDCLLKSDSLEVCAAEQGLQNPSYAPNQNRTPQRISLTKPFFKQRSAELDRNLMAEAAGIPAETDENYFFWAKNSKASDEPSNEKICSELSSLSPADNKTCFRQRNRCSPELSITKRIKLDFDSSHWFAIDTRHAEGKSEIYTTTARGKKRFATCSPPVYRAIDRGGDELVSGTGRGASEPTLRSAMASYGLELVMQSLEAAAEPRLPVNLSEKSSGSSEVDLAAKSDFFACCSCRATFSTLWLLKAHTEEYHEQNVVASEELAALSTAVKRHKLNDVTNLLNPRELKNISNGEECFSHEPVIRDSVPTSKGDLAEDRPQQHLLPRQASKQKPVLHANQLASATTFPLKIPIASDFNLSSTLPSTESNSSTTSTLPAVASPISRFSNSSASLLSSFSALGNSSRGNSEAILVNALNSIFAAYSNLSATTNETSITASLTDQLLSASSRFYPTISQPLQASMQHVFPATSEKDYATAAAEYQRCYALAQILQAAANPSSTPVTDFLSRLQLDGSSNRSVFAKPTENSAASVKLTESSEVERGAEIPTSLTNSLPSSTSSTTSNNHQQQKRARTRITDEQLKVLRANFDINNSPTDEQYQKMCTNTLLPLKVVKHWFRNTLFKERQKNKDSPYNFNIPPLSSSSTLFDNSKREPHPPAAEMKSSELGANLDGIELFKSAAQFVGLNLLSQSPSNKSFETKPDGILVEQLHGYQLKRSAREMLRNSVDSRKALDDIVTTLPQGCNTDIQDGDDDNSRNESHAPEQVKPAPPYEKVDDNVSVDFTGGRTVDDQKKAEEVTDTFSDASECNTFPTMVEELTGVADTCHHGDGIGANAALKNSIYCGKNDEVVHNSAEDSTAFRSTNIKVSESSAYPCVSLATTTLRDVSLQDNATARAASCGATYLGTGDAEINSAFSTSAASLPLRASQQHTSTNELELAAENILSAASTCYTNAHGGSSKRANRTKFSEFQLQSLQNYFDKNPYPKDDDLEYLSTQLKLAPRVITVWFQNQRQKARKNYGDGEGNAMINSSSSSPSPATSAFSMSNSSYNSPAKQGIVGVEENHATENSTAHTNTGTTSIPAQTVGTSRYKFQCKTCCNSFHRYFELIKHQQQNIGKCFTDLGKEEIKASYRRSSTSSSKSEENVRSPAEIGERTGVEKILPVANSPGAAENLRHVENTYRRTNSSTVREKSLGSPCSSGNKSKSKSKSLGLKQEQHLRIAKRLTSPFISGTTQTGKDTGARPVPLLNQNFLPNLPSGTATGFQNSAENSALGKVDTNILQQQQQVSNHISSLSAAFQQQQQQQQQQQPVQQISAMASIWAALSNMTGYAAVAPSTLTVNSTVSQPTAGATPSPTLFPALNGNQQGSVQNALTTALLNTLMFNGSSSSHSALAALTQQYQQQLQAYNWLASMFPHTSSTSLSGLLQQQPPSQSQLLGPASTLLTALASSYAAAAVAAQTSAAGSAFTNLTDDFASASPTANSDDVPGTNIGKISGTSVANLLTQPVSLSASNLKKSKRKQDEAQGRASGQFQPLVLPSRAVSSEMLNDDASHGAFQEESAIKPETYDDAGFAEGESEFDAHDEELSDEENTRVGASTSPAFVSNNNASTIVKSCSSNNSKRVRTTILPEQYDYLFQQFKLDSNPSRTRLEAIAHRAGLAKRVVQVWYQNTRARERKGTLNIAYQTINKRCPVCKVRFSARSALEQHLSTKHSDEVSRGTVSVDVLADSESEGPNEEPIASLSMVTSKWRKAKDH